MHTEAVDKLRDCLSNAILHVYWSVWETSFPCSHTVPSMRIRKLKLASTAWTEYYCGVKARCDCVLASIARTEKVFGAESARVVAWEHLGCCDRRHVLHAAISVIEDENAKPYRMRLEALKTDVEDGIGMGIMFASPVGGHWLYCADWSWIQEALTLGKCETVLSLGLEKLICIRKQNKRQ